ncbi:hypothetical protein GA0070624_6439 [Micromonospora rhizosphaerae]|uniref:Uncharacterized protein n=1 Tax=Micromonospora rhizosphaerae TaxID=568872 RepID=A0A1C6TC37_9ACTN|nr:hypothetical protein [Micromonospora rhizosphaerae]SCL39073.1 hypothetical protein GA0070624_6439 [Micromonospora rhizosphaerae]
MQEDASPFFIGPHRFDADDDRNRPALDRRYALVPEPGERVLGQHRLRVAGHLLGPTETARSWTLPAPATVTVTDRRIAYVCAGSELALVSGRDGPTDARHRRPVRPSRLVSGQIRWQWPSRLELPPAASADAAELLIVCDALRTIRQPALALGGPAGLVTELARQVRRAVAAFRLVHPELVDLSPPERDELATRVGSAPFPEPGRVTLPGYLPVEFLSRDDYYRPKADPAGPRPAFPARPSARDHPGSAC